MISLPRADVRYRPIAVKNARCALDRHGLPLSRQTKGGGGDDGASGRQASCPSRSGELLPHQRISAGYSSLLWEGHVQTDHPDDEEGDDPQGQQQ